MSSSRASSRVDADSHWNRRTTRASPGWSCATGSEVRGVRSRERAPLPAEDLLRPEQAGHGFRVRDFPLAHPGERGGERQGENFQEFLVVELRALVFELFREVDLDALVRIPDRDM